MKLLVLNDDISQTTYVTGFSELDPSSEYSNSWTGQDINLYYEFWKFIAVLKRAHRCTLTVT
jgi:hypothetical protein